MGRWKLGALMLCGLAAFCPLPGMAKTLQIIQQSSNVFQGADGAGGSIKGQVSHVLNGRQQTSMLAAGGFRLRQRDAGSTDAYTDFIAFCIEITSSLRTSAGTATNYDDHDLLLDPHRRTLIATLYQEVWDPTGSVLHQGAFQLALWKLAHGDVSQATGDGFSVTASSSLDPGVMSFTRKPDGRSIQKTFEHYTPGVFSLAQGWLDRLDGQGADWTLSGSVSDHVTFLSSDTGQDLVTAAYPGPINAPPPAIPVPPAIVLTGGAIGILGWMRLRRARRA